MLKNTKDQDSEIINKITNPKIKISVIGGLDYINKKKFNDIDYILRTIHEPRVLSKIIEIFEQIENGIKYTWTDRQKFMYVYKVLVERLHYKYDNENDYENGRDVVRTLEGLLYGKLVCSGFALVFKEAMDRIGIPCLYQNKQHSHSWNLVKLNNKISAVDLTWDCSTKSKNNQCEFKYFCRDKEFYNNKHHDISKETEEKEYELHVILEEDLSKNLKTIIQNPRIVKLSAKKTMDTFGSTVHYIDIINPKTKNKIYFIKYNNKCEIVILDENKTLTNELKLKSIDRLIFESKKYPDYYELSKKFRIYTRIDGSNFIIKDEKISKNQVNEYSYFDFSLQNGEVIFRKTSLLSEMDMLNSKNEIVANLLLNKDRLRRKINYYHGYVGFIDFNNRLLYDRTFEEQELGIKVRK